MNKEFLLKLKTYRFRILAGALFCVFLISTWFILHKRPTYPEELHISLQNQLKVIIQEALIQKTPQIQNFQFQKMWTQSTNKRNQISAHFKYSFNDETDTKLSIEGLALMNQQSLNSSTEQELWSVDHIEINHTKLDFKEPVLLFSGKSSGESLEKPESTEETSDSTDFPADTKEMKERTETKKTENKKAKPDKTENKQENKQAKDIKKDDLQEVDSQRPERKKEKKPDQKEEQAQEQKTDQKEEQAQKQKPDQKEEQAQKQKPDQKEPRDQSNQSGQEQATEKSEKPAIQNTDESPKKSTDSDDKEKK